MREEPNTHQGCGKAWRRGFVGLGCLKLVAGPPLPSPLMADTRIKALRASETMVFLG